MGLLPNSDVIKIKFLAYNKSIHFKAEKTNKLVVINSEKSDT